MTRQLRFATHGSAEGWARAAGAASPWLVSTAAGVRHDLEHDPTTLARYVVVEDGEVLGVTRVRRRAAEVSVMVQVHPDHQGSGVGSLLFEQVRRVAGDAPISTIVNGDDHAIAVARHWGLDLLREFTVSAVDPRTVPTPPPAPPGLRVVDLDEAGVEEVLACHNAAAADDPSGLTRQIPLEEYAATQWRHPDHRLTVGRAVLDGAAVLSFASVYANGERAWNSMTGTLPSRRGSGLARLVKQHSLVALAAAGVTQCATGNDAANAPMLAVNGALGYRPFATTWGARKESAASS